MSKEEKAKEIDLSLYDEETKKKIEYMHPIEKYMSRGKNFTNFSKHAYKGAHMSIEDHIKEYIYKRERLGMPLVDPNEWIDFKDWDITGIQAFGCPPDSLLYHKHFDIAFEKVLEEWQPKHDSVVFVSCTMNKPYDSNAKIMNIVNTVKDIADVVIISSCGIIPVELGLKYPYAYYNYDTIGESQEMKTKAKEVIYNRLDRFLQKFNYKCYSYLTPGKMFDVIDKYSKEHNNCIKHVITNEEIDKQVEALRIKHGHPEYQYKGVVICRANSLTAFRNRCVKMIMEGKNE